MKEILLISGSNKRDSINFALIQLLKEQFTHVSTKILDLRTLPLPMYNPDDEINGIPDNAIILRKEFDGHDTILLAIPEYNGSMPAFFKNALDWLSRVEAPDYKYFTGKKLILVNATPGYGGQYVLQHMRDVSKKLGAEKIAIMQFQNFHQITHFNDEMKKLCLNNNVVEAFNRILKENFLP